MTGKLISQVRWQMVILYRNKLIHISAAMTLVYGLIFYFLRGLPNIDKFFVLLIFNDPALIGLLFIGLGIIMEKDGAILEALFVTPLDVHTYLFSRILALSFIGWACATGMVLALLGTDISWFHFSLGVFTTCVIFSLAGIYLISYTTEFLVYLLRSIPLLLCLSLPLLNFFDLTSISWFNFTPLHHSIQLIESGLISQDILPRVSFLTYALLIFWMVSLYLFVHHIFAEKIRKAV